MNNYIHEGERLQVVAPAGGIESGQVVVMGSKLGVAVGSAAEGETTVIMTEGVFELAKATGAITQGQRLYYDADAKKVTTAITPLFIGYATSAAGANDLTAEVLIPCNTGFPQAANQAASTASDAAGLKTDFNALLTKLKAAGIMIAD